MKVYSFNYEVPGTFTFLPLYFDVLAISDEDAINWINKYLKNHLYTPGDNIKTRDAYNQHEIDSIQLAMRHLEEPGNKELPRWTDHDQAILSDVRDKISKHTSTIWKISN